jgi:hypothetical protein
MTRSGILAAVAQPLSAPFRAARYVNGSTSEWVVFVPPPHTQAQSLRYVAWQWLRDLRLPLSKAQMTFQRVPWIDDRLGQAVLHHSRGRTVIYCSRESIADDVTVALSQITLHSIGQLLQAASRHGLPHFHIMSVEDTRMPGLHRVIGVVRGAEVRVYARSDVLSASLAATLSTLGTEYLRCHLSHAHGRLRLLRQAG